MYVSAPLNIAEHFDSFYSTAVGIVFSGVGVGIFVLSPLIETLITVYGWRGAVLLHGAIDFHIVALGALLPLQKCSSKAGSCTGAKPAYKDRQYHPIDQRETEETEKSEWKDLSVKSSGVISLKEPKTKWHITFIQLFTSYPSMVLVYIVTFLVNMAHTAALAHTYNQIILNGYSEAQGAWALSLLGIGSLFGRLFHGVPIDKGIMLPSTLYETALVAGALVTFVNPLANNYIGYIVTATGMGFVSGILFPLLYTIMKRKVGTSLLAPAVGLELLFDGLGIMTGGYLAGM